MTERALKSGFTTGTAAAAAAKAALAFLRTGECPAVVEVPLPPGGRLSVAVHDCRAEAGGARGTVIKNAGDDPDCTHGEEIQSFVHIKSDSDELFVTLEGGRGVGRTTLPGLPVEPGQAAINPAPRKQIVQAVLEGCTGLSGHVSVLVEVPRGEELAAQTMNPRLGIIGGISILGTQGIVKPYSHDSWRATIAEAMDVARAAGLDEMVFATGRRTERFYLEAQPDTDPLAVVQAADFYAFACKGAGLRGFSGLTWSVFFGKLVKQAQGLTNTHAKTHPVDFELLARHAADAGAEPTLVRRIREANTAMQVLDMLEGHPVRERLIALLVNHAEAAAATFAEVPMRVRYRVFGLDGSQLV